MIYLKQPKNIIELVKHFFFKSNRSRFERNFLEVASANTFAQLLAFLISPILTRLFSPNEFGIVAVFTSFQGILLSFAILRIDWSIPNTKSRVQAVSLFIIGTLILFMVSIVTLIIVIFLITDKIYWKDLQDVELYLLLLPVALVGQGLQLLLQSWYIRESDLSVVGKTRITQTLASTAINILGGIFRLGAWALIVSTVSTAWIGVIKLLRFAANFQKSLMRVSITKLKVSWIRFWRESLLSTSVAIINTVSLSIIPLLLAQLYSTTEVGWYAFMMRLVMTPISTITGAIGQSFWAEAAILIKHDRAALRKLYLTLSMRLSLLAIPIVLICLCGPLYTGFIFGQDWSAAGYILASLSPFLFGQIVVSPISHLIIHRKQHWQFIWDTARFLLLIAVFMLASTGQLDITQTVLLISITLSVMYALLFKLNLANL